MKTTILTLTCVLASIAGTNTDLFATASAPSRICGTSSNFTSGFFPQGNQGLRRNDRSADPAQDEANLRMTPVVKAVQRAASSVVSVYVVRSSLMDRAGAQRANGQGSGVVIEVEWVDPQTRKTVRHRAEDLTWSRKRSASMPRTDWVFTGSKLWRGNFVAEVEQSYIATWPDGGALFNNPLPSQNPYRGNLLGYEANKRVLPPVGTAATVIVTPSGPAVP